MNLTNNELNTIRGLFSLFTQNRSAKRSCILLSESFRMPLEEIEEILKEEIRGCVTIKVIGKMKKAF